MKKSISWLHNLQCCPELRLIKTFLVNQCSVSDYTNIVSDPRDITGEIHLLWATRLRLWDGGIPLLLCFKRSAVKLIKILTDKTLQRLQAPNYARGVKWNYLAAAEWFTARIMWEGKKEKKRCGSVQTFYSRRKRRAVRRAFSSQRRGKCIKDYFSAASITVMML